MHAALEQEGHGDKLRETGSSNHVPASLDLTIAGLYPYSVAWKRKWIRLNSMPNVIGCLDKRMHPRGQLLGEDEPVVGVRENRVLVDLRGMASCVGLILAQSMYP